MTRTDRLLGLIGTLRDGRLHRAEDLARAFGVSQRTVYRDLDTLIASGVPIAGERGLGYKAVAAVTLPPLNLTPQELDALDLGLALLADDATLGPAARSLAAKLGAAGPEGRVAPSTPRLAVGAFAQAARGFRHVPVLRAAIRARQKLRLTLADDVVPSRTVRPLAIDYWGRVWTLTAWCETTTGFANLRVDLVREVVILPQLFVDEPGRTLADLGAGGLPPDINYP